MSDASAHKRAQRALGDEELAEVEKIGKEIEAVESDITAAADKYEECRRILSYGVASVEAAEQTAKMDALLARLRELKERRSAAKERQSTHAFEVIMGDERAVALEEVRDERARKRARYGPGHGAAASKGERPEAEEAMLKVERRRKALDRTNAANCPNECKVLVEDTNRCALVCQDCGYVYEDLRCNSENKFCTMGKFGEEAEVPRRRSGGYKPPNHFAEIVGYFQGTRSSSTPKHVLEAVRGFCARYKYEPHEITPKVVRYFLRQMQQDENNRHANAVVDDPEDKLKRYTDFYRGAPEIAYKLSGIPPPYLSPMQEDRVLSYFPLVIAAYKTSPRYLRRLHSRPNCVKPFPNNPNNSWVFYKIMQMLGYVEFLPYIPLPKSMDNIDDNDMEAWDHICKVNGWQYLPTR